MTRPGTPHVVRREPGEPLPDDAAGLRAANARLRELLAARDARVEELITRLAAAGEQVAEFQGRSRTWPRRRGRTRGTPRSRRRRAGRQTGAEVAAGKERAKAGAAEGAASDDDAVQRPSGAGGAARAVLLFRVFGEPGRHAGGRRGPPAGDGGRRGAGRGHRASDRRPAARLRHGDLGGCAGRGDRAGPVRAARRGDRSLPVARTVPVAGPDLQPMADLFGCAPSPGALASMTRKITGAVALALDAVRDALAAAGAAHFDETGFRVAEARLGLHSHRRAGMCCSPCARPPAPPIPAAPRPGLTPSRSQPARTGSRQRPGRTASSPSPHRQGGNIIKEPGRTPGHDYATVVEFEGWPLASCCPDRAWRMACGPPIPPTRRDDISSLSVNACRLQ